MVPSYPGNYSSWREQNLPGPKGLGGNPMLAKFSRTVPSLCDKKLRPYEDHASLQAITQATEDFNVRKKCVQILSFQLTDHFFPPRRPPGDALSPYPCSTSLPL